MTLDLNNLVLARGAHTPTDGAACLWRAKLVPLIPRIAACDSLPQLVDLETYLAGRSAASSAAAAAYAYASSAAAYAYAYASSAADAVWQSALEQVERMIEVS